MAEVIDSDRPGQDLIESGSHLASAKADVIKTHHNDTALVRQVPCRAWCMDNGVQV